MDDDAMVVRELQLALAKGKVSKDPRNCRLSAVGPWRGAAAANTVEVVGAPTGDGILVFCIPRALQSL